MEQLTLPKAFLPILNSDKRYRIAVGGRGSGKSQTIAGLMIVECLKGKRILCAREFQNSITESVHSLIVGEIARLGAPNFTITSTHIRHAAGGEFIFRGLARNTESIKSLYGVDICWIEEAQTLSEKSLQLLTPTIREAGSYLVMTANPRSMADPFTQRFLVKAEAPLNSEKVFQDDISTVIKVNYDGNPFFPAELEQERVEDKAKLSAALYQHVWEGSTYDEVDNSIIELAWFEAAIDLADRFKVRPSGSVVCGFDPSDMGGDDSGLVVRHGPVLLELGLKSTGDVSDKLDWAVEATNKHNADVFIYDGDGLGLGLGREVDRQLGHRSTSIQRFHGGEIPDEADAMYDGHRSNRDAFFNRRAQAYWLVRDRFYKSYRMSQGEYVDPDECIFLRSDMPLIDQLRAEVCRIPRKPNAHGKIQIMPKEQMAKEPYCLPSPNLADALVYSFAVTDHLYGEFNKPIEYEMDASYI